MGVVGAGVLGAKWRQGEEVGEEEGWRRPQMKKGGKGSGGIAALRRDGWSGGGGEEPVGRRWRWRWGWGWGGGFNGTGAGWWGRGRWRGGTEVK